MDDNLPVAATSDAALERAKIREDVLRNQLVELTGSPDSDKAIAEFFEGFHDENKKDKALRAYIKDGRTIAEIAHDLRVPERTVAAWAFIGKWNQPVALELSVRQEEEALQLARLRIGQRRTIIQRQLDSAQMVRDKVINELDDMSAKSAAEALKAAADIEARALGMSESGRTEFTEQRQAEAQKSKDSKVPLVVVVQNSTGSGIPVLGKAPKNIIDVTE
jgi:hypothetical protein